MNYKSIKILPGAVLTDIDPKTNQITNRFMISDTRELYEENKKKFPERFTEINDTDISYNLNSDGYRAPEWKEIDWKNSLVILGCSTVFGIGLAYKDTISSRLENLLGDPVINLGVPGSGITFSLHNSFKLFESFGTPKAVIIVWPALDRFHLYKENFIFHTGAWTDLNFDKFFYHWGVENEINGSTHSYFNAKICKEFWKSKTVYQEYTFSTDVADILGCDLITFKDSARDLLHPGPNTAQSVAETIYQKIKNIHRSRS